jgi:hypothetical protein
MHTVKLWLKVEVNGETFTSDVVDYEVPWIEDDNTAPVIWTR